MTAEIATQEAKLKSLTELQERMKLVNKAYDAYKKNPAKLAKFDLTPAEITKIQRHVPKNYGADKVYQSWELTNNNAVINNTKKRIEELTKREMEKQAADENKEFPFAGGTIVWNYDEDRVQIIYDTTRVDDELYAKLRRFGFVFSRTNGAFQRQLNSGGKNAAEYVTQTGTWSPEAVREREENQKAEREASVAQWAITPSEPVNIFDL